MQATFLKLHKFCHVKLINNFIVIQFWNYRVGSGFNFVFWPDPTRKVWIPPNQDQKKVWIPPNLDLKKVWIPPNLDLKKVWISPNLDLKKVWIPPNLDPAKKSGSHRIWIQPKSLDPTESRSSQKVWIPPNLDPAKKSGSHRIYSRSSQKVWIPPNLDLKPLPFKDSCYICTVIHSELAFATCIR